MLRWAWKSDALLCYRYGQEQTVYTCTSHLVLSKINLITKAVNREYSIQINLGRDPHSMQKNLLDLGGSMILDSFEICFGVYSITSITPRRIMRCIITTSSGRGSQQTKIGIENALWCSTGINWLYNDYKRHWRVERAETLNSETLNDQCALALLVVLNAAFFVCLANRDLKRCHLQGAY